MCDDKMTREQIHPEGTVACDRISAGAGSTRMGTAGWGGVCTGAVEKHKKHGVPRKKTTTHRCQSPALPGASPKGLNVTLDESKGNRD